MELDELAPGVLGYTMEEGGALYIPFIMASKPGNGDVGRYLDGLPTERTIKVPNVMNGILVGMLKRRGYVPVMEWAAVFEENCEVWVRQAATSQEGGE